MDERFDPVPLDPHERAGDKPLTAARAAQLAATILDDALPDERARALIEFAVGIAAIDDDLWRESVAHAAACSAFSSTTVFDAALAAFVVRDTRGAHQQT
jgi:hypothetical protein